jgi:hypothetical protein
MRDMISIVLPSGAMDEEDRNKNPLGLPIYGIFKMASLLASRDWLQSELEVKELGIKAYDITEQDSDMIGC